MSEAGIHHWFRTLKAQATKDQWALIATVTFHDLRHDFAHRAREAGWSLEEVAYYLGHVTKKGTPAIQTTARYTQVSREQVKAKLRHLGADARWSARAARGSRNPSPLWSTIDGAPPRRHLLAATVPFVQAASRLPGVTRVALIGSLTTEKDDPKDIDLLVTIAEETDVSALDRLARQLQGRISATARGLYGADVFLADPAGQYLGRLCKHRAVPVLAPVRRPALRPPAPPEG